MNYQLLATELSTDPRSIGYSSMTPDQIVSSLNTTNITIAQPINSRTLLVWGAQNGRLDAINAATTDSNLTPPIRSIALAALHIIQRSDTELDLSDSVQSAMPAALVSASVIQQSDADALTTLSQSSVSWASQHWGRDVTLNDLQIAGIS